MSRGEAINHRDYVGQHYLCDLKLNNNPTEDELISKIEAAISKSNMNIVSRKVKLFIEGNIFKRFFHRVYKFYERHSNKEAYEPIGLTGFWILSESHFSVHTYPESSYITLCCYTCGTEGDPESAIKHLIENLDVKDYKSKLVDRGNV